MCSNERNMLLLKADNILVLATEGTFSNSLNIVFLYIHKNIYIYMWYQYPVVLDVSFLLMFMHITCLNFSFSNMIYIYTYMCHINVLSLLTILVKGCDMYNFLFISCFVFSKSINAIFIFSLEIYIAFLLSNIYVFPILVFWPGDNNALFVFCIKWIYWIVIFTFLPGGLQFFKALLYNMLYFLHSKLI